MASLVNTRKFLRKDFFVPVLQSRATVLPSQRHTSEIVMRTVSGDTTPATSIATLTSGSAAQSECETMDSAVCVAATRMHEWCLSVLTPELHTRRCIDCTPGSYKSGTTGQLSCPPGSYCQNCASRTCSSGYYTSGYGSTSCKCSLERLPVAGIVCVLSVCLVCA